MPALSSTSQTYPPSLLLGGESSIDELRRFSAPSSGVGSQFEGQAFPIKRTRVIALGSTANALRKARDENDNSTAPETETDFIARYEIIHNATAPQTGSDFIVLEASLLLDAAEDYDLGDDYETRFYDQLELFIARYQKQAIEALTALIISRGNDLFGISKTLEAIGAINDPGTVTERFWLLQRGLGSISSIIRYGAALGFASLRDPRAIVMLEQVADREPNSEIKTILLQVAAFLKTSR
jgi:hypothetical protein